MRGSPGHKEKEKKKIHYVGLPGKKKGRKVRPFAPLKKEKTRA